eukprot:1640241-Rhodomonas_salina.1
MARAFGRWEENVAEWRFQQQVEKDRSEELERERQVLLSRLDLEQERHAKMCWRVVQRMVQRQLAIAWDAFTAGVHGLRQHRERVHQSLFRWTGQLLGSCMGAWKAVVVLHRGGVDKEDLFSHPSIDSKLLQYLHMEARLSEQGVQRGCSLRLSFEKVFHLHQSRRWRSHWFEWFTKRYLLSVKIVFFSNFRSAVRAVQVRRIFKTYILCRRMDKVKGLFFQMWSCLPRRKTSMLHLSWRSLGLYECKIKRESITRLYLWRRSRRLLSACEVRLNKQRCRRLIAVAFMRLERHWQVSRKSHHIAEVFVSCKQRTRLRRSLDTWAGTVVAKQEQLFFDQQKVEIESKFQMNITKQHNDVMKKHDLLLKRHNTLCQKTVENKILGHKCIAFCKLIHAIQRRQRCQKVLRRQLNKQLVIAWDKFSQAVCGERKHKKVVHQARTNWAKTLVVAWRCRTQEAGRHRRTMRKIVRRWEGGAMARAFGRWEDNAAKASRHRLVMDKIVRRMLHRG